MGLQPFCRAPATAMSAGPALTWFDAATRFAAMEHLHAPWRIEYILAPKGTADGVSVFRRIAESGEDEANLVILRGRQCFALLNRHPYNGGHLMVLPYRQVSGLEELTDDEMLELMQCARRCMAALKATMRPDGFNVGFNLGKVAGAGIVEHLHLHIVPRWNGDTNFMPVLAGTTVLPQALEDVAARLRSALGGAVGGGDDGRGGGGERKSEG